MATPRDAKTKINHRPIDGVVTTKADGKKEDANRPSRVVPSREFALFYLRRGFDVICRGIAPTGAGHRHSTSCLCVCVCVCVCVCLCVCVCVLGLRSVDLWTSFPPSLPLPPTPAASEALAHKIKDKTEKKK